MPNFSLQQQPKYPLIIIDSDSPISVEQLISAFADSDSITLCMRSSEGHPKRGGYFFCLTKSADTYSLETVEGVYIDSFSVDTLARFVNHASGRLFDREMLSYCQNTINFRVD